MIHNLPSMQNKQKGNLIWTYKHTPVPAQYPSKWVSSLLVSAYIKKNSQMVLFKQCLNKYFPDHFISCYSASRNSVSMLMDVSLEMNGVIVITQHCAGLSAFGAPTGPKDVLIQNMCLPHPGLIFQCFVCFLKGSCGVWGPDNLFFRQPELLDVALGASQRPATVLLDHLRYILRHPPHLSFSIYQIRAWDVDSHCETLKSVEERISIMLDSCCYTSSNSSFALDGQVEKQCQTLWMWPWTAEVTRRIRYFSALVKKKWNPLAFINPHENLISTANFPILTRL